MEAEVGVCDQELPETGRSEEGFLPRAFGERMTP